MSQHYTDCKIYSSQNVNKPCCILKHGICVSRYTVSHVYRCEYDAFVLIQGPGM